MDNIIEHILARLAKLEKENEELREIIATSPYDVDVKCPGGLRCNLLYMEILFQTEKMEEALDVLIENLIDKGIFLIGIDSSGQASVLLIIEKWRNVDIHVWSHSLYQYIREYLRDYFSNVELPGFTVYNAQNNEVFDALICDIYEECPMNLQITNDKKREYFCLDPSLHKDSSLKDLKTKMFGKDTSKQTEWERVNGEFPNVLEFSLDYNYESVAGDLVSRLREKHDALWMPTTELAENELSEVERKLEWGW
jgi:hypothetical protein